MKLSALLSSLARHPDAAVRLLLPDGSAVPAHFHLTEVGRVRKDFIDCGGTARSADHCVLQVWSADDVDHRVSAGKMAKIIGLARPILAGTDLDVEVEYDLGVITQLPVVGVESADATVVVTLGDKHTACLAPDRCGVPADRGDPAGCCAPAGSTPVALGTRA